MKKGKDPDLLTEKVRNELGIAYCDGFNAAYAIATHMMKEGDHNEKDCPTCAEQLDFYLGSSYHLKHEHSDRLLQPLDGPHWIELLRRHGNE